MKSKILDLTPEQIAQVLGDPPAGLQAPAKNSLAIAAIRQQSPGIPIDLFDMISIIASDVRSAWDDFYGHKAKLEDACKSKSPGSLLSEDQKKSLASITERLATFCVDFGFREACSAATNIRDQVDESFIMRRAPCTVEIVCDLMDDFDGALRREMFKKKLVFVAPEKERFLEDAELFGSLVNQAFPEAMSDIKDAGNCLAFDLNTAAVFHLMRIAEFGLRTMARRLRVTVKKSRIEFAGWSTLTRKLRKRIEVLEDRTNNPKKLEDLDFYHAAVDEIKMFKDYWRNEVMHTRGHYNADQAKDVFNRVDSFMRRLAPRVLKK
jgi:hypothetical protein